MLDTISCQIEVEQGFGDPVSLWTKRLNGRAGGWEILVKQGTDNKMDSELRSDQHHTKQMKWDSKENKGNNGHVDQMTQPA